MANNVEIKSTFFTDPDGITQVTGKAFGPNGATEADRKNSFRVSSTFQGSGKKAFAICKSQILIQLNQSNTNLVNLVLKPFEQPSNRLRVKYFVYRGLLKAEFFTGPVGNEIVIADNENANSDFINRVWKQFKKLNEGVSDSIKGKWLGIETANLPTETLIDSLFQKSSPDDLNSNIDPEKQFELPIVDEGDSLGMFSSEFSLDIVLDDQQVDDSGFKLDINFAKAESWTFNLGNLPGGISEKIYKENILQFIDPAAFFGLHANENCSLTIRSSGTSSIINGDNIYNKVIKKFLTKNNVYLYIHSDRGRSYNYYGNYIEAATNFNLIYENESLKQTLKFGSFQWPVQILNFTQNHSKKNNIHKVQLITAAQESVCNYCLVGEMISKSYNGFSFGSNLNLSNEIFSCQLAFATPAISDGGVVNIAGIISLIHTGKDLAILDGVTKEKRDIGLFDNIFLIPAFQGAFNLSEEVAVESRALSKSYIVNLANTTKQRKGFALAQTLVTVDHINSVTGGPPLKRILFETITKDVGIENDLSSNTPSKHSTSVAFSRVPFDESINNYYALKSPYLIDTVELTTGEAESTRGILISTSDNSIPLKILLGASFEQFNDVLTFITENNLKNPRFYFGKIQELTFYLSEEKVQYKVTDIHLTAENDEQEVLFFNLENGPQVFSLDECFFYTSEYASNIQNSLWIKDPKEPEISTFDTI